MLIIKMIKSRRMKWAGNVARIEAMRNNAYKLVGKPETKILPGQPKREYEDDDTAGAEEVGCEGEDWIHLCKDRDQPEAGCCDHGSRV
jgi:hypothetical protein